MRPSVEVVDDNGTPRRAKVTELRFLHIYANLHSRMQGSLAFADENLRVCSLMCCSHRHTGMQIYTYTGESGALEPKERDTVIQRTGGQDRGRKSLILNGARTDITRGLEIDGGRKRREGSE